MMNDSLCMEHSEFIKGEFSNNLNKKLGLPHVQAVLGSCYFAPKLIFVAYY